tara:strand:+ start:937 stop:1185 length:249 start_codon:yes stop_codon:yes gene_type:complete
MKKLGLILLLTSCSTFTYIKKSDFVITNRTEEVVFIKNNNIGKMIYESWVKNKDHEDKIIVLVDTTNFKKIYEKSYTPRRRN